MNKAAPGPWYVDGIRVDNGGPYMGVGGITIFDEGGHTLEDAEFIAHARQDIPDLIAELKRLRRELSARGLGHVL